MLLTGKKGLILGVANERSIAWHVAVEAARHGAECGFSFLPGEKSERRVEKTLSGGGMQDAFRAACDVASDESIESFLRAVTARWGGFDFIVHSVAFADHAFLEPGRFLETPRRAFAQALDISAYSLIAILRAARPHLNPGASIVTMTYLGSERVVPGYNVMGVAKAALEATVRYASEDLGGSQVRVNAISAGPIRTLSAMAIGGIDQAFAEVSDRSPLRRNVTADEVGKTAVYLLSDLSSGVTGGVHYVDSGFNVV